MKKSPVDWLRIISSVVTERNLLRRCTAPQRKRRLSYPVRLAALAIILGSLLSPMQALTTPTTGAIAAGLNHTVALRSDGTVWTWGSNSNGQLGDGTTARRLIPVQVSGLSSVVAVAAGQMHTVTLKSDGTVWSWGGNDNGQLGDGTTTQRTTPVQVSGLANVIAIAAGWTHTVALKSDGTVWSWGGNDYGQLGDGTTTQRTTPVRVSGLTNVTAIAAGWGHTLALKSDGTVWSWGCNNDCQLGDGDDQWTQQETPVQVSNLTGACAIAAGNVQSLALKSDGTVWIWGSNEGGMLGDGSDSAQIRPVLVSGLTNVISITAGFNHSAALKGDGSVWTWGFNDYGELSDGSPGFIQTTPTPVAGLTSIIAYALGGDHTVALQSDGTIWTTGNNDQGQMGNGTSTPQAKPVQVSRLTGMIAASAGGAHNVALKSNGSVWTWGANSAGQLGDGTTTNRAIPQQVSGISNINAVSAGSGHSLALKSDGTVWSWGDNSWGQLGDGTTAQRTTSVQVSGLTGVVAIAAGCMHSVALKNDGTVWAWGSNLYAQLGDGSQMQRTSPVQVSGLTGVIAIAAGWGHTVALKNDGSVWAWGENYYGQVGSGTDPIRLTPIQVLSSQYHITAICAGYDHTIAIGSDYSNWSWGSNASGQLGDGTTTNSNTASATGPLLPYHAGVLAVSAGQSHTIVIVSDNELGSRTYAWGGNERGQLGDGTTTQRSTYSTSALPGFPRLDAVSGGSSHTVAVGHGGGVWAWGDNSYGQLGFFPSYARAQAAIRLIPLADDTDQDGMSDAWEIQYFGNLNHNGGADTDGDGLTDIQEFVKGSNPTLSDTDSDQLNDFADPYPNDPDYNEIPTLSILSGDNQTAAPGAFNANPFDIAVWNSTATAPMVNVPVTFTVTSGGGLLAKLLTDTPASSLSLRTDSVGTVQVYYRHINSPGVASVISVTAGTAHVQLHATSAGMTGDSDGNGLPDSWEQQYFGHTGVSGSADADGDGRTNAQEYAAGTNPVDFYKGRAFNLSTSTTSGAGSVAYTYDASGRITLADYGAGKTIQYSHSAVSNLTTVTSTGIGSGTITAWRTSYGLPADGSGNGADTAILANDGLPNLAKYAFGLAPSVTAMGEYPAVKLTSVSGGDYLTLTYSRPDPVASDLTYRVEVSSNGTTWTSGTGATVDVSTTVANGIATMVVRDATAAGSPVLGRRIRLTIERRATP